MNGTLSLSFWSIDNVILFFHCPTRSFSKGEFEVFRVSVFTVIGHMSDECLYCHDRQEQIEREGDG